LFLAIVLFGEPIHWETSLQIITDILLTHGNPNGTSNRSNPDTHIPIIACNKDLVFKAVADLPRFGHGAFLLCLEALYKVCIFFSYLFKKKDNKIFISSRN
jgi:ribonucleotide monophosphatase NagD (HAD superfamily)